MNRLWPVLLPELQKIPFGEQDEAFRAARDTPLDVLELACMAAGLVLVTALTRQLLVDTGLADRFGAVLVNFVVAIPLLVAALGPFHIRRLRRGLRARLASKDPR